MFLKFGIAFLCLFAEIALGFYTYMHFESLLTRFLFFVFTSSLVAMVVIKLAKPNPSNNPKEEISARTSKEEREEN